MSQSTPIYDFYTLEEGDILYPVFDQNNMMTADNEFAGLYGFVGPGIISGWEVTKMIPSEAYSKAVNLAIVTETNDLIDAFNTAPTSFLGRQMLSMNIDPQILCIAATTVNITLSGTQTVDTVPLSVGDIVLVKNQTLAKDNGVYVVAAGAWTRIAALSSSGQFVSGLTVQVGTSPAHLSAVNKKTIWSLGIPSSGTFVLGTSNILWQDVFNQMVRVSPGSGIVGLFPGMTNDPVYFRYTTPNIYYIWAEAGACLTTSGLAVITSPLPPLINWDSFHTATYLATVEVAEQQVGNGLYYVALITYSSKRNPLLDLLGELQTALRLGFYRHVHLGGPNHPSKIQLSTDLILNATGPIGSTIFLVFDSNGNLFTWNPANYGFPKVLLNNVVLPSSSYTLVPSQGRIYLKNSLVTVETLQLDLPLSPQILLTVAPISNVNVSPVYLTDGVLINKNPDGSGGTPRIFTWDSGLYGPPLVLLQGAVVSPTLYSIDGNQGEITFTPNLVGFQNSDLTVTLTHVGAQIQGKLPGKRVTDIDASLFTMGVIDPTRIAPLDHVGQLRFLQPALLNPHLRLFSDGDHVTFYPELIGSAMQYNTEVFTQFNSVNFTGASLLYGTKRGLMQASDAVNILYQPNWNIDNGEPIYITDNILQASPGTNHFFTTYLLTKEGQLFQTTNFGSTWTQVKLPTIETDTSTIIATATAFWVSTERVQTEVHSIVTYQWSTKLYLGTNYGLFTATVQDGETSDEWNWTQDVTWFEAVGPKTVYALCEIVTLNITTDDNGTLESYDRTLYVGSDLGFTIGNACSAGSFVSVEIPKGFLWIRGEAENDLLWFTDEKVYISHTAKFIQVVTSTSSSSSWQHPLTNGGPLGSIAPNTPCVATTTGANVTLFGAATFDGVVLNDGDRALVRNQTNKAQNGIWIVNTSGAWTRALDAFVSTTWVTVSSGTLWANSAWTITIPNSFILGVSDIIWNELWVRPVEIVSPNMFVSAIERNDSSQYIVCANTAPWLITDTFNSTTSTWNAAVANQIAWSSSVQSDLKCMHQTRISTIPTDVFIAGSGRGLWQTSSLDSLGSATWTRTVNQFALTDNATLYDDSILAISSDGKMLLGQVDSTLFTVNQNAQAFVFNSAVAIGTSFVYEHNYVQYFVTPWNSNNADVLVYINSVASNVPYALNPALGEITFVTPLSPSDNVTITISRLGAFISNVGVTPHLELSQMFVTGNSPLTTLAKNLAPTDTVIIVSNPQAIPVTASFLELRSTTARERVAVNVDPITLAITMPRQSGTQITFPANFTQVYLVTVQNILGIEDIISKAQSNETYHLNSLGGANTLQLSIASQVAFPGLFTNFHGEPAPAYANEADRGPKDAFFFDFTTNVLDGRASSSTLFTGLEPTAADVPISPNVIFSIYNASSDGTNMRVGTDQGIWIYDGTKWSKDSALGVSAHVYFIGLQDGSSLLQAGTDTGLWQQDNTGTWLFNPTYPQAVYDHLTGPWFGHTFSAYGKNDGLAFVDITGTNTFISDHFDDLDSTNIYGLYYNQFIRISTDSSGNTTQTKVDALYLCTESGLWAVTNGSRGGQYSSILAGREMFGGSASPLLITITLPNGDTQVVSIKFYKIFQSPRPKTIPIIILTSNGVYVVRNWRWCDPTDPSTLNFAVDGHSLDGISCTCFATATEGAEPGPVTYKIFVGTNEGLFRSFNDGYSFERCEWIGGNNTPVYSIVSLGSSCLLVGTNHGLWYSNDDGDTWYMTDQAPPFGGGSQCVTIRHDIDSLVSFNGDSLAQTFVPLTDTINKVSLYLACSNLAPGDPSLDNTLTVEIYNTSGGLPTTPVFATLITNALTWAQGYQATSGFAPAYRLYDLAVNDNSTYYEDVEPSSDASITTVYDLSTSSVVTQMTVELYYTQHPEVIFEYSDDNSTWSDALTTALVLPDNFGSGHWVSISTQNIVGSSHRYWRLSAKDATMSLGVDRDLRIGDHRLFNGIIQYPLPEILLAADIKYTGFQSMFVNITGLNTSLTYALVATETVAPGGVSVFSWVASTL